MPVNKDFILIWCKRKTIISDQNRQ